MISRYSVLPLAAVLAVGCGDPAGTDSANAITIAIETMAPPTLRHGRHADNTIRVECETTLRASAVSPNSAASAQWTGATLQWYRVSDGQPGTNETMTAAETAEFWGSPTVTAGFPQSAEWLFWASEPFRVEMEFRFRGGGSGRLSSGTSNFTLNCIPAAAPLSGRYALTRINDLPLPARSESWDVFADTLEFFSNLTYTTSGRVGGEGTGGPYSERTGPHTYTIVNADTVDLPTIIYGTGGGRVARSGTRLHFFQPGCCGRPSYTWRFDLVGSPATFPPTPVLVSTPSSVSFTAVQGGPLPAQQVVNITSSTGSTIPSLNWTGSSTCANPDACMSNWLNVGPIGYSTPSVLTFQVFSSAMPVGTHRATVFVKSDNTGYQPVPILVTYTVTAP